MAICLVIGSDCFSRRTLLSVSRLPILKNAKRLRFGINPGYFRVADDSLT